ncbi:uncharacterized protein PFL1_06000 [Pseudozyma flocculosa PF-1]|uniref:Uncharacterized protein n=1 Tax=Pseudozyma flocculosa PF-1 TaxID=1277687 RepID=A0A061H1A1_9BASI|nr:uncharacterized protein PFL1_06000 [Pseudozyma flocculosa PF-1]EPQ26352.1 hypothetical protein PFL1_06000 [Pseudozyma flocculosa PF-1]
MPEDLSKVYQYRIEGTHDVAFDIVNQPGVDSDLKRSLRELSEETQEAISVLAESVSSAASPPSPTRDELVEVLRQSSEEGGLEHLSMLQQRLRRITTASEPVDADDLHLATALVAMLAALEQVRGPPRTSSDPTSSGTAPDVPSDARHLDSKPRSTSARRRDSFATARSSHSEELDNPFGDVSVDAAVGDAFGRLHRRLISLHASTLLRDAAAPLAPGPAAGSGSARTSVPSQEAWQQLSELVAITKELVAWRSSTEVRPVDPSPQLAEQGDVVGSLNHASHASRPAPGPYDALVRELMPQLSPKAASRSSTRASMVSVESGRATLAQSSTSYHAPLRASVWSEHSLPPSYGCGSLDTHGSHGKVAADSKDLAGFRERIWSLPSYTDEEEAFSHLRSAEKEKLQDDEAVPQPAAPVKEAEKQTSTSTLRSQAAAAYAARTPEDLLVIQHSIERLYSAVPQFLNQRCSLPPDQMRDDRLQRMMDKLAATPRLNDQRADPPSIRTRKASDPTSGGATGSSSAFASSSRLLGVDNDVRTHRRLSAAAQLGRKFSVTSLANTLKRSSFVDVKGKAKERDAEMRGTSMRWSNSEGQERDFASLDELFASVHRAQDMDLGEQRVAMKPRPGRKASALLGSAYEPESVGIDRDVNADADETLFQLLNNQGQARMAGQDAIMAPRRSGGKRPSASASASRRGSQPDLIGGRDDLLDTTTPRASISAATAMASATRGERGDGAADMVCAASHPASVPQTTACESSPLSLPSSLARGPAAGAEGTALDAQTVALAHSRSVAGMHYILETQANLFAINGMATVYGGSPGTTTTNLVYEVCNSGSASVDDAEDSLETTLHLSQGPSSSHPDVTVPLPGLGVPLQRGSAQLSQDHFAFRLSMPRRAAISSAPSTHLSHSSEPVAFPFSSDSLALHRPPTLSCAGCDAVLADLGLTTRRYRALPSQHWEELVDAWMCHGDQELNESVARGKQGLEEGRPIPSDEVWVADLHLMLPASSARPDALSWDAAAGSSHPTATASAAEGATTMTTTTAAVVRCTACLRSVGAAFVSSSTSDAAGGVTALKLHKHAISSASEPDALPRLVSAQMLDVARAHAAYHFVLADEGSGRERILDHSH